MVVDDGSTDETYAKLKRLAAGDPRLKVIHFGRNFGQTAAMAAGFDYAEGDVVVPLDGDLQNDPADIALLLDKLDEGYDVVSGWRKDRKDNLLRRHPVTARQPPDRLGDRRCACTTTAAPSRHTARRPSTACGSTARCIASCPRSRTRKAPESRRFRFATARGATARASTAWVARYGSCSI